MKVAAPEPPEAIPELIDVISRLNLCSDDQLNRNQATTADPCRSSEGDTALACLHCGEKVVSDDCMYYNHFYLALYLRRLLQPFCQFKHMVKRTLTTSNLKAHND